MKHESHGEIIEKNETSKRRIASPFPFVDTKGPEIRIKTFENDKITLEAVTNSHLTRRYADTGKSCVSI